MKKYTDDDVEVITASNLIDGNRWIVSFRADHYVADKAFPCTLHEGRIHAMITVSAGRISSTDTMKILSIDLDGDQSSALVQLIYSPNESVRVLKRECEPEEDEQY